MVEERATLDWTRVPVLQGEARDSAWKKMTLGDEAELAELTLMLLMMLMLMMLMLMLMLI